MRPHPSNSLWAFVIAASATLCSSACLDAPPLPTSDSDDAGASDSDDRRGGPDAEPLPMRDPSSQARLTQGGGFATSPKWAIVGRIVSGGAVQTSPHWRLTSKIVF